MDIAQVRMFIRDLALDHTRVSRAEMITYQRLGEAWFKLRAFEQRS